MNNVELIAKVRGIAEHGADWRINVVLNDAADALEAAEKRIAELMPKEGEWIQDELAKRLNCYLCSVCGEPLGIDCDGDEYYLKRIHYCPNCGAKMKTVTDCHTSKEGER